jgi:dihydroorotate dehydrogenase (fumarate)
MNIDLTTQYLGLTLANPIVVSACPLTGELDVLRQLEAYGAAAAVLPSLFEEQFDRAAADARPATDAYGDPTFAQSMAYFRELKQYNRGPEVYLKHLTAAKQAVSIPLIGSLNVTAPGDWIRSAARIQEAGADALELNIHFLPTDPDTTSGEVEARYVDLVAAVRSEISIPLAVKIGPYFTALSHVARRLVEAGADGLVLFNRFMQPDIDLDTLRVQPRLVLSSPDELRLTLRWIALLHGRLQASLAASTGAHFADDAIKLLLAGADVVMVASTLYRHGVDGLMTLVDGVRYWLESNDYQALHQVRGTLSQRRCPDPAAFERSNYTKALSSFLGGPTSNRVLFGSSS